MPSLTFIPTCDGLTTLWPPWHTCSARLFWCTTNAPAELLTTGITQIPRDVAERDGDENFRLLRDIAKARKHVHLKKGDPLVKRAEQVTARRMGAGELKLAGASVLASVVVDMKPKPGDFFYVTNVVDNALAFLEAEMHRLGI